MRGSKEELNGEVKKAAEKLRLAFGDEIKYELPCGDKRRLIVLKKV